VGVKNRLANVLRARRVFVWVVFDGAPDAGSDQSHAVRRASGVHVAPKAGEMVAKIRARSRTGCQRTNEPSGPGGIAMKALCLRGTATVDEQYGH
jgi:hypothetical protein